MRIALQAVVWWLGAALAAAAWAQAPSDEAEVLADRARKLAESREFGRAAALFRQAFSLNADSRYAWNAARVLEFDGDFAEAHLWYVRAHATAPTVDKRAKVTEALGAVEAKLLRGDLARIVISVAAPDARVGIDAVDIPRWDHDHVRWLNHGAHIVVVEAPGHHTETVTVAVAARVAQRLSPTLRPLHTQATEGAAGTVTEIPRATGGDVPALPIGLAALGAVGLGLGGYWMSSGAADKTTANGMPIGGQADIDAYRKAAASANGTWQRGAATVGVGAVAASVAAWLWWRLPARNAQVAPMLNDDAAGLTFSVGY
ncbi:MAG: hypothetical protein FJ100_15450 [Deltaproteobacteria bacterium]|nr:hypothetical protein [Deltaproteobacteria bacterium]